MPTSAYAWGGATGAPASASGTSAAPYAEPSAAPMNSDGAYTPPTNPLCRQSAVAESFTNTSWNSNSGEYGVRYGDPDAPSMLFTLSKPWYVTSGNAVATHPNTKPPKGACHSRGILRVIARSGVVGLLLSTSPVVSSVLLVSVSVPSSLPCANAPRSSAANPTPSTDELARNATATPPHRSPNGRYNGSSARFFSSNAGTTNAGCSPSSAFDTTAANTLARMTLSVVDAPKPVLPPPPSVSKSSSSVPPPPEPPTPLKAKAAFRLICAGCNTASNAKNNPAIGAPKPALIPAALPAATKPSRLLWLISFRLAFWRFVSCVEPPLPPATPPVPVDASFNEPAIAAPISTEGPSGPKLAPAPRVTTAAAAFSAGRKAARAPVNQLEVPVPSPVVSVPVLLVPSSSFVTELPTGDPPTHPAGHRGFVSPSNPPARNRKPVTKHPANVGAAIVATACAAVASRTSRAPSTWNRSGEYTVVVRNTRSCTPCSAMLNTATPSPVSKPTPHATSSASVGAGSSESSEVWLVVLLLVLFSTSFSSSSITSFSSSSGVPRTTGPEAGGGAGAAPLPDTASTRARENRVGRTAREPRTHDGKARVLDPGLCETETRHPRVGMRA
mmetsp:Transcript_6358/g.23981  ORF Transcript_6358/g.23981 Transcript_6358/m.23981 type:complete len:615 (+) Transcript_6358:2113-3957(+)